MPPVLTADYAGILAVVLAASFLQGASGFGFGITATSVLPFFVEAKLAAVYVAVWTPVLCGRLLWGLRRHAALGPVLPVIAGSILVGVPLGQTIYAVSNTWLFKQIVGLTLAASCTLMWAFGGLRPRSLPRWTGLPVGVLSGTLTGACNVGGAPLIVYMWTQPLDKHVANARLQTVFTAATCVRLAMLLATPGVVGRKGFEAVTWPAVRTALTALPLVLLGAWLGLKVFHRINQPVLRRCAYAFVIVLGLVLFARTRWGEEPPRAGTSQPAHTSAAAEWVHRPLPGASDHEPSLRQ